MSVNNHLQLLLLNRVLAFDVLDIITLIFLSEDVSDRVMSSVSTQLKSYRDETSI